MAENPPIRPQRGMVRNNRETIGGLLMSVIRSLSTSRDLADRDRERAELEKGYVLCDQKLNELVAQHNTDLYHMMNTFSKILNNLGRSKEKLLDTREKLMNCEKLLHCKRDELKKLWLELYENKAVFDLLERIETVANLPKQVDSYISKKYYLHAAQCCVEGLRQLGEDSGSTSMTNTNMPPKAGTRFGDSGYGSLRKIEALSEVRSELIARKDALFESAIDELHRHLYLISSADVRKRFHRTGSFRSNDNQNELSAEKRLRKMSSISLISSNNTDMRKLLNPAMELSNTDLESASLFRPFDSDSSTFDDYPEEDSRQFISMLTKCLGLMNKVSEAIEVIRDRCDREFINIVIKTAQEVLVTSGGSTLGNGSGTRSNSYLDISSIGSDSLNNTFEHTKNFGINHQGSSNSNSMPIVLTCTTLLGHAYNGYSHLLPPSRSVHIDSHLQLNKSSLQLQDFFDLLMRQYRAIVSLHESIVLPNLQKIESGLHAFTDHNNDGDGSEGGRSLTNFYSASDLWAKVQSLVQQLLEFYLDSSHNYSSGSTHLPSNINNNSTMNFLFNHVSLMASSGGGGNSANNSNAESMLPSDYSSYFAKRRPLVGAMNAMNVMSKNTLNAVVNSAAANSNDSSSGGHATGSSMGQTNTLGPSGTLGAPTMQSNSSSSTSNFLSNMVGNSNRGSHTGVTLFKFDNSSQAMAWNGFLAEQQQQSQQLLSPKDDNKKSDDKENEGSDESTLSPTSASVTSPSVIGKLFETLRTISTPSPDNLVIVYETLMKFAQQCPPFTDPDLDLDARSIRSINSTATVNQYGDMGASNSTLQTYLVSAAEKFAAHINEQLEKMMEVAQKSLESGNTISIAHMSPLTAAFTLNENESSSEMGNISKAQQNQHHFAQQQLNSKLYPPLLESAVLVDMATRDLRALMQAMPDYSNIFLGYICNYLSAFKDACLDAYNGIVETAAGNQASNYPNSSALMSPSEASGDPSSHGATSRHRIISAKWAKDEDITRLLKYLPNWKALDEHQKQANDISYYQGPLIPSIKPSAARRHFKSRQLSSFDESPEEIRLRNMKETEILIQTLSQEVRDTDVLSSEKGQFRQLAQMQESFEWIAARCKDLVNSIEEMKLQVEHPGVEYFRQLPDVYIATLNSLALDFADLAETVLLMMHLEVRVHCFYNLQQLDSNFFTSPAPPLDLEVQTSRTSQEHYSDDPKIFPLLDDLKRMHDEFQRASLKSFKMVYIFEGLDHLIATTFINSVNDVKRIKHLGIKRTCRAIYDIQRRLSTITKNRELALDYARQFFELFLTSPEEILTSIVERGPTFHASEYEIVLTLLHQSGLVNSSNVGSVHLQNAGMEANLERLRDILNHVTVQI